MTSGRSPSTRHEPPCIEATTRGVPLRLRRFGKHLAEGDRLRLVPSSLPTRRGWTIVYHGAKRVHFSRLQDTAAFRDGWEHARLGFLRTAAPTGPTRTDWLAGWDAAERTARQLLPTLQVESSGA